jgi:Protein of unknown function (DUF1559)
MAMCCYADAEGSGRLPPAAVCGKDGTPLLSWRVLILPYVEDKRLYERFNLDEPWDSPHNIALLSEMPSIYAPPPGKASKVPPYHTVCHVFVGKDTAFEGHEGLRVREDFPDDLNTFMVVEAGKPVPWTKPEELVYDPNGPLPELTCLFRDGFRAAHVFPSVRFINKSTSEAELRAAITRHHPRETVKLVDWCR